MKKLLHSFHLPLLIFTIGLGSFGLVMVYSASYFIALEATGDAASFVKRQGLWFVLGLGVFFFVSMFKFTAYKKLMPLILAITIFALLLIFIPGVGTERNQALRWISIGPLVIQPSELAKIAIPLYVSFLLVHKRDQLHDFKKSILPSMIVVLVIAFLIMLQPDLGTVISLAAGYLALLIAAQVPIRYLLLFGAGGVLSVTILAITSPYRLERLTSFRAPFDDPDGAGYQLIQSWTAMANGGFTGAGFGESVMKLGYLPESHTDFIIAIIAEEFGFIGTGGVIIAFAAFLVIGFSIAMKSVHPVGRILGIGITIQIATQAIMNLAAAGGVMPITGIPLPLVSYGGSSLLITMTLLGILMNIHRMTYNQQVREEIQEAA